MQRPELLRKVHYNTIPTRNATTTATIMGKDMNADITTVKGTSAGITTVKGTSVDIITEKVSTAGIRRVMRAAAVIMENKLN